MLPRQLYSGGSNASTSRMCNLMKSIGDNQVGDRSRARFLAKLNSRSIFCSHLCSSAQQLVRGRVRAFDESWQVDALADLLCGQNLCGPAASLQKAGVNGSDFLVWTSATEIVTDVHVPLFTAKKLLACRAEYLGAF